MQLPLVKLRKAATSFSWENILEFRGKGRGPRCLISGFTALHHSELWPLLVDQRYPVRIRLLSRYFLSSFLGALSESLTQIRLMVEKLWSGVSASTASSARLALVRRLWRHQVSRIKTVTTRGIPTLQLSFSMDVSTAALPVIYLCHSWASWQHDAGIRADSPWCWHYRWWVPTMSILGSPHVVRVAIKSTFQASINSEIFKSLLWCLRGCLRSTVQIYKSLNAVTGMKVKANDDQRCFPEKESDIELIGP